MTENTKKLEKSMTRLLRRHLQDLRLEDAFEEGTFSGPTFEDYGVKFTGYTIPTADVSKMNLKRFNKIFPDLTRKKFKTQST